MTNKNLCTNFFSLVRYYATKICTWKVSNPGIWNKISQTITLTLKQLISCLEIQLWLHVAWLGLQSPTCPPNHIVESIWNWCVLIDIQIYRLSACKLFKFFLKNIFISGYNNIAKSVASYVWKLMIAFIKHTNFFSFPIQQIFPIIIFHFYSFKFFLFYCNIQQI